MHSASSDPGRMPSDRLSAVSSSLSASDVAGNDGSTHAEASFRSDGSIDSEDERDLSKANVHISRTEQIYAGLLDTDMVDTGSSDAAEGINGESTGDESICTDESLDSEDDIAKANEYLSRAERYYSGLLDP